MNNKTVVEPASVQQLTDRVAELEQQLQDARQQHESLMYTLSHDLRTPLMTILGFTDMLIGDAANGQYDSALQYLQNIRQASLKQSKLFEELLKLSRLMRCEIKAEWTDIMDLARTAVERQRMQQPNRAVKVDIGQAIPAYVDRELFGIALEALINNAWKFTGKTADAHISITTERGDNELLCTVRDNGAGFEPSRSERLFQPLRRLHSEKEFPGVGMGLVTAALIIRRHGGRIWVESKPGGGCSFFFTVKRPPESPRESKTTDK